MPRRKHRRNGRYGPTTPKERTRLTLADKRQTRQDMREPVDAELASTRRATRHANRKDSRSDSPGADVEARATQVSAFNAVREDMALLAPYDEMMEVDAFSGRIEARPRGPRRGTTSRPCSGLEAEMWPGRLSVLYTSMREQRVLAHEFHLIEDVAKCEIGSWGHTCFHLE